MSTWGRWIAGAGFGIWLPIVGLTDEALYLQVAAFSVADNAKAYQQQLRQQLKRPVRVMTIDTGHKTWHRVQVGPFTDPAQAKQVKAQIENSAKTTRLWNLRDADIRGVVEAIAQETGKNFLIDPAVTGKISIISNKPLEKEALYQVFLSMLEVSGYSALESGNIVKIIPNTNARTQSGMLVRVLNLNYVPAEQLVPALRPLIPAWHSITSYSPANALIISGSHEQVRQVAEIVARVDTPDRGDVDILALQHALAQDVVQTMTNLRGKRRNIYGSAHVSIAADDRSNSVLISGHKAGRLRMRVLISELDRKSPRGTDGNTQVVFLKFMRATDIVPILAGVAKANFSGNVGTTIGKISKIQKDPRSPSVADMASQPGGLLGNSIFDTLGNAPRETKDSIENTSQASDSKPKVEILAEPNTNAVILNAPPSVIRILKSVIAQLDSRPAQVLIEALIAEVDEDRVRQLGIDWGSLINTTNADGSLSSAFQPGIAILNSKTNIKQFEARIQALATIQKANILSKPAILVLDNHQAKILVGQEVSVEQSTFPNNAGGNTSGTPYTTFARLNVALHLFVTPQISSGDTIQLQIDQGNDTLQNPNDTSGRPVVNKSAIVTSVIVNNNEMIVLGGLNQNQLQLNDRKIPILGQLPGIGSLFQNNQHTRSKKVLMVFLKPQILHSDKAAVHVTQSRYNQLRRSQLADVGRLPYTAENKKLIVPDPKRRRLPMPFRHDYL